MSLDVCQRFINGLKKEGLTLEEVKTKWRYAGGNRDRRYRYFKLAHPDKVPPEYKEACVCSTRIVENCYISDGTNFLVIGSCCIDHFVDKRTRTCKICDEPHKNRKVNKCNDCRIGYCDMCDKPCNPRYKTCYKCHFS